MPSIVMDVCRGEKLSLVDCPAVGEAYNGFDLKNWVKKTQSVSNEIFSSECKPLHIVDKCEDAACRQCTNQATSTVQAKLHASTTEIQLCMNNEVTFCLLCLV